MDSPIRLPCLTTPECASSHSVLRKGLPYFLARRPDLYDSTSRIHPIPSSYIITSSVVCSFADRALLGCIQGGHGGDFRSGFRRGRDREKSMRAACLDEVAKLLALDSVSRCLSGGACRTPAWTARRGRLREECDAPAHLSPRSSYEADSSGGNGALLVLKPSPRLPSSRRL